MTHSNTCLQIHKWRSLQYEADVKRRCHKNNIECFDNDIYLRDIKHCCVVNTELSMHVKFTNYCTVLNCICTVGQSSAIDADTALWKQNNVTNYILHNTVHARLKCTNNYVFTLFCKERRALLLSMSVTGSGCGLATRISKAEPHNLCSSLPTSSSVHSCMLLPFRVRK